MARSTDDLRRLDRTASVLFVVTLLIFAVASWLGYTTKSFILPIEAIAGIGGVLFAVTIKQFVLAPSAELAREARRWLLGVAITWVASFALAAAFRFNPLNLLDAAIWLPLLFFMRRAVVSMERLSAAT